MSKLIAFGIAASAFVLAACGDQEAAVEPSVESSQAGLGFRSGFSAEYLDCDEFAGVGLVPLANVQALVPSDYTVIEAVPGQAIFVAQGGDCREIRVGRGRGRPGIFAQIGIGVAPPLIPGQGDFYQLAFATNRAQLAARLRALGVNARFTPRMKYEISATPELTLRVPRPFGLAFKLQGPITLPDPNDPPQPLTTFNYYTQGRRGMNVLQQNAVSGIRFGTGPGVQLTAIGADLEAIIGGTTLSFPFFSNPETFDRTDLTVVPGAF